MYPSLDEARTAARKVALAMSLDIVIVHQPGRTLNYALAVSGSQATTDLVDETIVAQKIAPVHGRT